MPAHFDMNTNIHAALKREVARLRDALDRLDLGDAQQREGYARRYGFFSETLHHHHHGEDEYLFPKVRSRAKPEEVVILDAMAAEHHTLQASLARLDEDFATLSERSDTVVIREHFDELLAVLEGHCAHEERDGVPVIEKYITDDDLKPFNEYNRTNPNGTMVLAWVCDGATQQQATSTWGMLPGFVRVFVRPMANRKYARFTAECGV
jgi:hemerythrin-like domain-containing protein